MLVVLRRQVLTGTPLCGLTWLSLMSPCWVNVPRWPRPRANNCSRAWNVLVAILTHFCSTRSVEYIILGDVYVCKCCYNDMDTLCSRGLSNQRPRTRGHLVVFLCFFCYPIYILTTYLLKYTSKDIYVQNDINIKINNLGNRLDKHWQRIKRPNKKIKKVD